MQLVATTVSTAFTNPRAIEADSTRVRLLGGSWVVISGVLSRVTIVITQIRGLITPLITTHEPPSTES